MIKAKHNKLAKFLFDFYLQRLLKSSFDNFYINESFPEVDKSKGLLVTPNHFSWWDGFFIYWVLNKKLNRKIYIMMLEDQLKKYWFFNYLGCYSINLQDVKSSVSSLRYTLDILSDNRNVVVIYPQGEIQPYEKRPIELKGGIDFLANKTENDFLILAAAFKIHYSEKRLPTVYSAFSQTINSNDIKNNDKLFNNLFVNNLDKLDKNFLSTKTQSVF
jgi:hypothetical protein